MTKTKQASVRRTIALRIAIVLVGSLALVPAAHAVSAPIQIHGTGTDGVFVRPTPDTSRP